jgi:6-pyruvoyl-tetrahydropterin synthase
VFYSTVVSKNFHERVMNLRNCNKKNVVDIRKLELAYRELISYRDFTYLMQSWKPCETAFQTFTLNF